jgi:ribosomal protein L7/L12
VSKQPRISFATSDNIVRLIDEVLLPRGLYGPTRADVVATIVQAQVTRMVGIEDVDRVRREIEEERNRADAAPAPLVWWLDSWGTRNDTRPGKGKIAVIRVVREYTGLGLMEAKGYIETAPVTLPDMEPGKAASFRAAMTKAGALLCARPEGDVP